MDWRRLLLRTRAMLRRAASAPHKALRFANNVAVVQRRSSSSGSSGGGVGSSSPHAEVGTTVGGRTFEYVPEVGGKGVGEADMSVASIFAELMDDAQLDTGTVVHIKGSVARVQGLDDAQMGAIVSIGGGGMRGLVVGLRKGNAVVALLGEENAASDNMVGETAQLEGDRLGLPAAAAAAGAAISPLGEALPAYAVGAAQATTLDDGTVLPLLGAALPSVAERSRTTQQLFSGLKVVDTFFPLGHGQKLGFVGDRGTGKRRALLDLIRNQQPIGAAGGCLTTKKCVYVSVGQSHGVVSKLAQELGAAAAAEVSNGAEGGLASSTTLVVARPTDSWGMHYLAPFAGLAIANAHRTNGEDVLLVIDDAASWTRVAVEVAQQFVGHPMTGIAPLHASVLEHAGALRSGGSLTTVSVVDTVNEDLSEPTVDAVISLVDVVLPFDSALGNAGTSPALSTEGGLGVGGSAPYQAAPVRALARSLTHTMRETAEDQLRADLLVEQMGLDIDEEADDDMREALSQRALIKAVLDQGALRPPATSLSNDITKTVAKMAAKARARESKGRSRRGARAMTGRGGPGSGPAAPLCSTPAELMVGLWTLAQTTKGKDSAVNLGLEKISEDEWVSTLAPPTTP